MPSDPLILAFDTSAAHCAAALLSGDRVWVDHTEQMEKGQAERLMPMLDGLLRTEGFDWSDLDLIAVSIGPGNFTGIRIGVSAARGLALGLGIPAMGVSTFEVMRGPNSPTDPSPQVVSVPARRMSAFVALFSDGSMAAPPTQVDICSSQAPSFVPDKAEILGYEVGELAHFWSRPGKEHPAIHADLVNYGNTIARIAQKRWSLGETTPIPPSPLYVRAADAAPSRDAPPVLLD